MRCYEYTQGQFEKKVSNMKTREVIDINRTMTLQELCDFMQQHWDKEKYNDFVVGRPGAGAFQDYIMLPATARCVVCVYPRKNKVLLVVMTNSAGQRTLAGSLVLGGYGRMGMVGEMQGVASQANTLYAAYLESLFAGEGKLPDDPKQKQPPLKGSDPEQGGTAGNVLELVKIAPPESRGISILSMVLSFISLGLFFTGIPGLAVGIAAILAADSVLRVQGFQPQAYTGRFCGKIAVCMSSVVAFIFIFGNFLTRYA